MWKKILKTPDGFMKKSGGNHDWVLKNYNNMLRDIPDTGLTINGKSFTGVELRKAISDKIADNKYDFKLYHTVYKDGTFSTRIGELPK